MNDLAMHVIPMQSIDIDAVIAIEQQVQSHPWTRSLFEQSLMNHRCTVLKNDQHILGFCILQPVLDEANLLLIAITPSYQGQGLGFMLLEQSIERLGSKTNTIFLEVRQSNVAAQKLYEKAGFVQIDVRKNYYPTLTGKEDAVLMALTRFNCL